MSIEISREDIDKYYILERKSVKIVKDILSYYKCERCGKCCNREEIGIGIEEYPKIMKKYKKELEGKIIDNGLMKFVRHPCPFFVDNKCSIHEDKFFVCDVFPFTYAYGFFIGLTMCGYGNKIYKDLKEFVGLCGQTIGDGSSDDTSKVVEAVNSMTDNLNKESYLKNLSMVTIPYPFLFKFRDYVRRKNKGLILKE